MLHTLITVVLRVAYLQVQRGHTVPAVRDGEESSVASECLGYFEIIHKNLSTPNDMTTLSQLHSASDSARTYTCRLIAASEEAFNSGSACE